MWLSKDERKLLVHYFRNIRSPNKVSKVDLSSSQACADTLGYGLLRRLRGFLWLGRFFSYFRIQRIIMWRVRKTTIPENIEDRYCLAATNLGERGLMRFIYDQSGMGKCDVSFTLRGWDLARKYNWWFTRTGLWWDEYKGHYIWPILGSVFGYALGFFTGVWIK